MNNLKFLLISVKIVHFRLILLCSDMNPSLVFTCVVVKEQMLSPFYDVLISFLYLPLYVYSMVWSSYTWCLFHNFIEFVYREIIFKLWSLLVIKLFMTDPYGKHYIHLKQFPGPEQWFSFQSFWPQVHAQMEQCH